MVETMSTEQLQRNSGALSQAVMSGNQLMVTRYRRPIARVVPADHYDALTAELEHLRAQVAQQEVSA